MKVDQDLKERVKTGGLFLLESYKIIMGTFLTVFVPHTCVEECSTVSLITRPHNVALGLNYGAFLSVLLLYCVELRRENWMIKHLDIDPGFPDVHLATVVPAPLKQTLLAHNLLYWKVASLAMLMTTINIVSSSLYLSSRTVDGTITTLVSFSLLVLMKLTRAFQLSRQDAKEARARSAYLIENTSYNVLDVDLHGVTLEIVHDSSEGK